MRARVRLLTIVLLLTSSLSLPAQSKTPAKRPAAPDFAAMMKKYLAAWETLDPAQAAPYYAKDAGLAFYDIAPEKYTGWAEYAKGVTQEFGDYASGKFFRSDDVPHPPRREGRLGHGHPRPGDGEEGRQQGVPPHLPLDAHLGEARGGVAGGPRAPQRAHGHDAAETVTRSPRINAD